MKVYYTIQGHTEAEIGTAVIGLMQKDFMFVYHPSGAIIEVRCTKSSVSNRPQDVRELLSNYGAEVPEEIALKRIGSGKE